MLFRSPQGTADTDGDGLINFLEYSLGSNPHLNSASALPVASTQPVNVNGVVSDYLTIDVTRPIAADDASYAGEACTNLGVWVSALTVGSPAFNGNGTETVTYRHPNPKTANGQQFLRLRVTKLP